MSTSDPDRADPAAAEADSPAFLKAVSELGQRREVTTSRAIFNRHGVKLLEGGIRVDASLYDRLVSHQLAAPLDESVRAEPPFDGRVLREAAEWAMARWPFFGQMGPAGRVRGMLLQSIEAVALPRRVAFQLTVARETRPALFDHSVLMALLCAHLVREGGAPIHDMTVAASAGLLHDLGMLHIDPEQLAPGNRLDGDARRPLYAHPMTASMLVERSHAYPREVARAILEHHERLDGSGYPRGLAGDAISPLGRLLSLGEVVTAMFDGERSYPHQRVSLLLRLGAAQYDPALVPSIHRLLRAMPVVEDPPAASVAESVGALRTLARLAGRWRASGAGAAGGLAPAAVGVLDEVGGQGEALLRSLSQAGLIGDQLEMLTDFDDADDADLRTEMWLLTQELDWQMRSTANLLRRRWRAVAAAQPFPPAVAAWLDEVEAVDATP